MYIIALYVLICTSPIQCDEYQPQSWVVSSQEEEDLAFEQCAAIERQWISVQGYKESDCYYVE
jgi:hypothetical protein